MATVSVSGLFETMLVRDGRIVLEREHLERLNRGAITIGAPELDRERWDECLGESLGRAGAGELAMRSTYSTVSGNWKLSAELFPLPELTLARRRYGRVALLPPSIRRVRPEIKSVEWLSRVHELRAALPARTDEGLLTNSSNEILEGISTNVFALTKDRLITPPLSSGILPGIVRAWILQSAKVAGLEVEERPLNRRELLAGSFLTSSLSGPTAIREVDGESAADPGEPFEFLARRFRELR